MFASGWARLLAQTLLLLFICLPCQADDYDLMNHITMREYPSGSFSVRYGGLRGFVRNQISSQLRSLNRDWLEYKHQDDIDEIYKELDHIYDLQNDIDRGGPWFERRNWWDNLLEEKGGAPNYPIRVFRGPVGNLIDIGVAYLTSDLRFKWREYEISLTELIDPSEFEDEYDPIEEWRLRFKPQIKFSSSTIIRRAQLGLFFEYYYRGLEQVSIELYISWYPSFDINTADTSAAEAGFSISFLQW